MIGDMCNKAYGFLYSVCVRIVAIVVVPRLIANMLYGDDAGVVQIASVVVQAIVSCFIIVLVPALLTALALLVIDLQRIHSQGDATITGVLTTKPLVILVIGQTGAGKASLINLLHLWSKQGPTLPYSKNVRTALIKTKYLDGDKYSEGTRRTRQCRQRLLRSSTSFT